MKRANGLCLIGVMRQFERLGAIQNRDQSVYVWVRSVDPVKRRLHKVRRFGAPLANPAQNVRRRAI